MSISNLYVPGDSFVHNLAPQTKILIAVMTSTMILFSRNIIWMGFMALVSSIYFSRAKIPFNVVKFIFVAGGMSSLFVAFSWWIFAVSFDLGQPVYYGVFFGSVLAIYSQRFTIGIAVALRFFTMITLTLSWLTTTPQMDTIIGFRKFRLPYGVSMVIAMALRLIPTFSNELHIIYEANQVRGIDFSSRNFLKKIKATVGLIIPIVTFSLRHIMNLGNALDSRGFKPQLNPKRTYTRDPSLGRNDYLVIGFFLLLSLNTFFGSFLGYMGIVYW